MPSCTVLWQATLENAQEESPHENIFVVCLRWLEEPEITWPFSPQPPTIMIHYSVADRDVVSESVTTRATLFSDSNGSVTYLLSAPKIC